MSFWTDEKLYKLVRLYSKFNNLWDRNHDSYDNLRRRYTSYCKILRCLSMPTFISVSDIICKLKELRNIYVYELKKIEVASRSGCIYRPNDTWFEIMNEFLYDNLDADEKLTEFSFAENGRIHSEEISQVCQPTSCCSYSNSSTESDSNYSINPANKNSFRNMTRCLKSRKKSKAYFLRSPTVLKSTKMNTKYELPGKKRGSSIYVKKYSSRNGCSNLRTAEDNEQCVQLDVKMTSSDVSIKYLRTENVNGDEKCYKKNLKGPRRSTNKPPWFKNIKMMISKSGYTENEFGKNVNGKKDEDTEFWEMMSMLDLSVPCPLTKLEITHSPNTSCTSIAGLPDSQSHKNHRFLSPEISPICFTRCCENVSSEKGEERTLKSSKNRFCGHESCCERGVKILEPCRKEAKVACLGDGTLFDENLLELLQDTSIKICPIDGQCASGNCNSAKEFDDICENTLLCKTCSSATRPVKNYDERPVDVTDDDSLSMNHETVSKTEENIDEKKTYSETDDATTPKEQSEDLPDGFESSKKPDNDLGDPDPKIDGYERTKDGNPTPLNTEEKKKVDLSISSSQRNQDFKMLLRPAKADSRSLSERETILYEARKELLEAGKLYNGGKYITNEIIDPDSKYYQYFEFDDFGAQVASSLKSMGKQKAMKLKEMISETLKDGGKKKF